MKHSGKDLKKYGNLKIIDCTKCKFIHIVPLPSKKKFMKNLQKLVLVGQLLFMQKNNTQIKILNR